MRDDWGTTGIPEEDSRLSLISRVQDLAAQDVALAEGSRMRGFAGRQTAQGFRQPVKLPRPPEVDVGALLDLGS